MSGITVDPGELDRLAGQQDQAADSAHVGARRTKGLGDKLWLSHGVVSGSSNAALSDKEHERATAGRTIAQACRMLAEALRAAGVSYSAADENAARHVSDIPG